VVSYVCRLTISSEAMGNLNVRLNAVSGMEVKFQVV
jgi:hypothetical protein